jgi:Uma2 family endonuclease
MVRHRNLPRYTYADYVAVELANPGKHEFLDGEIFAMAGGTEDHSALALETLHAIRTGLGSGSCRVHTSDLRIYVEAFGLATYADGSVISGTLEQHPPSPKATALNPSVLVEVTSESSETYDTTTKLEAYLTIPSLTDYVIVSHRERRITVHQRDPSTGWQTRVAISGGKVPLVMGKVELVVDDIYRGSAVR